MNNFKIILLFMLILSVVFAQINPNPPAGGDENPTETNPSKPPEETSSQQPQPQQTSQPGKNPSTKGVNPNPNTAPGSLPNAQPTAGVPKSVASQVPAATSQPNSNTKPSASTVQTPSRRAGDNGTPKPTIDIENGDTATHKSTKSGGNFAKYLLIGGGIIAALVVVGFVMNFINKQKNKGKDPMDLNFVVQDPVNEEPEMSTSMFSPQQPATAATSNYGNDYQYGQYGASNNQYDQAYTTQPATNNYDQGYQYDIPPPPENPAFNYNQRTLSLNRQPSAGGAAAMSGGNAREVIYNHRPEAGDEIELRRGDQAEIYEKYEDGWAWGYNITTGKTGMFPQQCLN